MRKYRRRLPDKDKGMTLLEVVLAISIFLIGIGFVVQSNAVSYRYRANHQLRQQMIFYAAGQMEALLEHKTVSATTTPFVNFEVYQNNIPSDVYLQNAPSGTYLQQINLTVYDPLAPQVEPVSMDNYRVWVNP